MPSAITITTILDIPLLELRGRLLDITESGKSTPGRFRLVDCEKFTQDAMWTRRLCVDEFSAFPPEVAIPYAALSYVWRGNPIPPNSAATWGAFNVKGAADDSDPIGIAILVYVCYAAWNLGYKYLWLDRLCIIQDDRNDKAMQIRNMFSIYRLCGVCLVLPGGIQRLVPLQEETHWITRAWTLQEAVAPEYVYVVFDSFDWRFPHRRWSRLNVQEVLADVCSMAPLTDILANAIPLIEGKGDRPAIIRDAKGDMLTSESARVQMIALWGAMKLKGPAKEQAIWRSALMRTSSRPVDMVFSIMGLFGITLNTHGYGVNDRLLASKALAQATLQTGRPANWLGISSFLSPSKRVSTFPEDPQTALIDGVVRVGYTMPDNSWRDVAGLMNRFSDAKWWLVDLPSPTSMDDSGYLTFSSRAAPVEYVARGRDFMPDFDNMSLDEETDAVAVVATDGTVWNITKDFSCDSHSYLIYIGRQYPWDEANWVGDVTVRAIVVEECGCAQFRVRAWCWLGDIFLTWIRDEWEVRSFKVGGSE